MAYTSGSTVVTIDSEMGCVSLYFYRLQDGRQFSISPVDMHEYLSTSEHEKALLLSTDPADSAAASALFNKKFLLNQPAWKDSSGKRVDLEKDLRNFSGWLQVHASLCIQGNFSKWPALYEYKIQRARAEMLRRGKDEQVRALVKDEDGKYKMVKQSTFQKDFEYIEKLKEEFLS